MKNVFFALLACLLSACSRALQPSPFPGSIPADPVSITAGTRSLSREAYASSDAVAAAAGSVPHEERVEMQQPHPAGIASHQPDGHASAGTLVSPQHLSTKQEAKELLRNALLGSNPRADRQDIPPAKRNGLALAALLTGIVGLISLVLGWVASAASRGRLASVLILGGYLSGLVAAVAGRVARKRIRDGKGTAADRNIATAGMVLGLVNVIGFALVLSVLFVVLMFGGW